MLHHDKKLWRQIDGANFLVFLFLLLIVAGLSVDGCELLRRFGGT
jgi:hypothetical protein